MATDPARITAPERQAEDADAALSRHQVLGVKSVEQGDYEAFTSEANERLRYQFEFAQAALKNLLLVNGGAILALLTALGNSAMDHDDRGMFWAFVWFGLGLVCGLSAYFGAFYSQLIFYNGTQFQAWNAQARANNLEAQHADGPEFVKGNRALTTGLALAAASLASFILGSFVALEAIL